MLGILAAFTGIGYALVKFLTSTYVRQLQDRIQRLQADILKNQQLVQSLEAQSKVAHTKKDSAQNKLVGSRKRNEDLYFRLMQELPPNLHFQLEKCLSSFPVPNKDEIKTLVELQDKSATQQSTCLLLLKLNAGPEGAKNAALRGAFAEHSMLFESLDKNRFVCKPSGPEAGLALFRTLLNTELADDQTPRAGSLVSLQAEASTDNPAQSTQILQEAQQLLSRAPSEAILLNESAYQQLDEPAAVEVFDEARSVYVFAPLEDK